ncbi:MAG: nucleoside deaminase [Alphaproteobacteria bacterium]|nr:nucleoside deaminase [Alphaproteobacteria bacterium]
MNMKYFTHSPMIFALEYAFRAFSEDEVPIGAIILDPKSGKIITAQHNQMRCSGNPIAHAEICAITEACRILNQQRLNGYVLYVTLEPCPMCAQAISFARLDKVIFGAYDPKGGGIIHGPRIFDQSTCHFQPEIIGGVHEEACQNILKDFFISKR